MEIVIRKIVITGRSLKVTYQKNQTTNVGEISDEISIKCGALLHDDFFTALNRLKIHFAALCDFREAISLDAGPMSFEDFCNMSNLDSVYITGLQMGGDKDDVEIMGGKTKDGRCLNMTSPKVNFEDLYIYLGNLYEAIEGVKNETHAYLFNDKCAIKQLALDFDGDVDIAAEEYAAAVMTEMGIAKEEQPKKRGRNSKIVVETPQTSTVN